uniref:Glycerol-3-phosphate acyltransferase n=1 Tax=Thermoanaerobaculum aquaticum TaxID=1312852 RepID=A0A7V1ZHT5_9BACT
MRGLVLLAAYLLGSIPFAYLVVRLRAGMDIRTQGSGTVGATNASRVLGLGWGLAVMLLDVGKGLLAVWVATRITGNPAWHAAALCSAAVGHCFPLWLSFHGGKGLATTGGGLLLLSPLSLALSFGVWLLGLLAFRVVAVASSLTVALLPVVFWYVKKPSLLAELPVVVLSVVLLLKHAPNLRRWVRGEEPKVGGKP